MYYLVGWPKAVNLSLPGENTTINHICCDAVKILIAAIGADFLGIWYANPLVPITFYRRNTESVCANGINRIIIWKPDSRQLAVLTSTGTLLLYRIDFEAGGNSILTQVDPPSSNLKRDSAELFIKENIPALSIHELCIFSLDVVITTVCCISLTELLMATDQCEFIRIDWAELQSNQSCQDNNSSASIVIKLKSILFYVNQNCNLKSLPPIGDNAYVSALEYSPFIGGCAAVFSDNRAAYLIATHLKFEAQSLHGFWVPNLEDATVCGINHKFRLLAYGRKNSDVAVFAIEEATGNLELSHCLSLNYNMPENLGAVKELKWSPDGCVLAVAWKNGGISLWSTFGTLLMSSLNWDFGFCIDTINSDLLKVLKLEWSTEGYHLFMIRKQKSNAECQDAQISDHTNVLQLNFVKSVLTMNPCMTSYSHILLQGDDTLYINQGDNLEQISFGAKFVFPNDYYKTTVQNDISGEESVEVTRSANCTSKVLSESKYWNVIQLPVTYAATNWPIRYCAIDFEGLHLAVAGRTGFAHYSMVTRKWKLFGNETQEKDFVVSGGMLWWMGFVIMGSYSLLDSTDEIRCYPEERKLDNEFGNKIQVSAPVISVNMFQDQLIALTADGIVSLFWLKKCAAFLLKVECVYEVDVKSICLHPACIVSLTVTNLRNDFTTKSKSNSNNIDAAETIIVNVCGRILMIHRDSRNNVNNSLMASCLASCVECFWLSNSIGKSPISDCLWLYSGVHGMRVWLPIFPPTTNEQIHDIPQRLHAFMSKRIMLSFPLKLYPLVILFNNVIVLGVENETTLYTSEKCCHFGLPFCLLERKSQVYLHKILRQLIKRNLGYSAWRIAKSCRSLPYFSHSLELLLHEVLEEEATSKEPIPDALLPSVFDFIREFPMYLQTIVQCARKTEIALWPYLFSIAGKPKDLFQMCLQSEELETAASYLIILQNLEPSVVSKQYATLLLDIAVQNCKWELAKDLLRFLKAIDPNEIDSPRSSMVINVKIAPPSQAQSQVNQNPEVFKLILGPIARELSFSATVTSNLPKEKREKSLPNVANPTSSIIVTETSGLSSSRCVSNSETLIRNKYDHSISTNERKEIFCIETILQSHARKLLQKCKLIDLGYMSALLDFHLVTWLSQETERSTKINDFIATLSNLHEELKLPVPTSHLGVNESVETSALNYYQLQKQFWLDNRQNLHSSNQTSESGYVSIALMDTPTSTNNNNIWQGHIGLMKENEKMHSITFPVQPTLNTKHIKSPSNPQILFENLRYRRLLCLHDDISARSLDFNYVGGGVEVSQKLLSEKLSIKLRYLLQLFFEANCMDYSLLLSIILQDMASIGRIINVIIRSESVTDCQRIKNILQSLEKWCFEHGSYYLPFMSSLQPDIYLLNQFIMTTSNAVVFSNNNRQINTPDICNVINAEINDDGINNLSQAGHNGNSNLNWAMESTGQYTSRQKILDTTLNLSLQNSAKLQDSEQPLRGNVKTQCAVM